jgi:hypothetical protein
VTAIDSPSETAQACPALTFLNKRAIRTAQTPVVLQALIAPLALATGAAARSTAALIVGAIAALVALALLPAEARRCRQLSSYRILRADVLAVNGIVPYAEYRQSLASLPNPGRAWSALGAPTPEQRLRILQEVRARG